MGLQILVLEDDKNLNEVIKNYLLHKKYEVTSFYDGEAALKEIYRKEYDLYIIDIMIPKGNGIEILKEIRGVTDNPVLIITALDSEEIEIKAFKERTDDYIKKPFSPNKLLMRIEAILRRTKKIDDDKLEYKGYTLDLNNYSAFYDREKINLLRKEFELLKILIINNGRILSREKILDKIWGYDYFGSDRVVDAQIKNIRKKLKVDIIKTVKGVGYIIE